MPFKAVRADKTDAGQDVRFVEMEESELMDGDVTVRVTHSTVNYKDGLALSGKSSIIRRFPMVLGVDLAGVVETSSHSGFSPGDEVILNGYGLSETHFGGYAEKARVKRRLAGQAARWPQPGGGDGDRNGRLYRDAGGDGARATRADARLGSRRW